MSAPDVRDRFDWQQPGSLWASTDGEVACLAHVAGMEEAALARPRARRHRLGGQDWRWVSPAVRRFLAESGQDRCPACLPARSAPRQRR